MVEDEPDDIPPTARLFWMAHHFRIRLTFVDRYELECLDGYEDPRTLPRAKVRNLLLSGDLVIEPHYFDLDGKPAKPGGHIQLLAGKSPSDLRRTMIAWTKARMFDRAHRAGKVKLYETRQAPKTERRRRRDHAVTADVWLKQNEALIHAACRPFYVLDPGAARGHEKPRLGQFALPSLGSVSTLKKDRQKMRCKGFKITDLTPKTDAMRNGGRKLADDMAAFVKVKLRQVMLRPEQMTMALFRRYLKAELRLTKSMAMRTVPSTGAIERLIETLDNARVVAAWFGEKKAVESRTIFTEGPRYTYPGEMVLMDCWKIDLVARLNEQGGWIFVSDTDLKEEWGFRRRLWVAWVIDACSRAILGLALGLSESPDLTTRALRMAVTDKTLQSRDAGCEAKPIPPFGIDGLTTDIGVSFTDPRFMVTALTLVPDADVGPGDSAYLHGLLERYNRTVKDQLMSFFTGTTFGNVMAKGDYDAMGRASADVEMLGRALWLNVCDVYNLSQHRGNGDQGVGGQPPINRLDEKFNAYGAPDAYSEEQVRIAFGHDFNLPLTREGICFASNHYYSGRLQTYFRDNGRNPDGSPRKLRAKIDLCDLGRISVFFEGEWHTLAGPARMRGVGFTDWQRTRRRLKKLYGEQAAANADIVARALRKLEEMGTAARLKSQVRDMSYDSEEVVKSVNGIRLRIKENEVPMEQGRLLAFDSSSDEASFPATGIDPDAEQDIEQTEYPYADAGTGERVESDMGLDNSDIDVDGDRLEPVEYGDDESDPEPPKPKAPPARPAAKPLAFLPQPTRRNDS
jgi:transposase InsO family protein